MSNIASLLARRVYYVQSKVTCIHMHHHAVCMMPREEQLHKVLRRPQRLVRKRGARVREEAEQREECRGVQQWRRLAEEEAGGVGLNEEDHVRLEHCTTFEDERTTGRTHKPQSAARGPGCQCSGHRTFWPPLLLAGRVYQDVVPPAGWIAIPPMMSAAPQTNGRATYIHSTIARVCVQGFV